MNAIALLESYFSEFKTVYRLSSIHLLQIHIYCEGTISDLFTKNKSVIEFISSSTTSIHSGLRVCCLLSISANFYSILNGLACVEESSMLEGDISALYIVCMYRGYLSMGSTHIAS